MAYQHPTVWYDSLQAMRVCQAMFALKPIHDDLNRIDGTDIRDAVHAIGDVRHEWAPPIRHQDDSSPARSWVVTGMAMAELHRVLGELRMIWMEIEMSRNGYQKVWLAEPPMSDAARTFISTLLNTTPPVEAAFDAYVDRSNTAVAA